MYDLVLSSPSAYLVTWMLTVSPGVGVFDGVGVGVGAGVTVTLRVKIADFSLPQS